ncbi:YdiU domain-containing protein, partial [Magnaporthiopsis poae ATCC 64411]
WAGQLGDGRVISLFEATNPRTAERYEVQLKGAGLTPYSRFADGKAVLRSSIREFAASEALHGLGIPTTRALALSLLPHQRARRETIEPAAIVVRFAQSWIRLGTFDLLRSRGDRALIRRLATYVAEDVLGGWDALPGRLPDPSQVQEQPGSEPTPHRGVPAAEIEGPDDAAENRFTRVYREVARRNAETVAYWQAYGFMNGVLNTDNTSIMGLSMDFGPFAFLDNFDPNYTPNHDDVYLRYSYKNQPTVVWWSLVRLGEALGELMGAGAQVDDPTFEKDGVKDEAAAEPLVARAEKIIGQVGDEYKAVFLAKYKRLMAARMGLRSYRESDFDGLFTPLLDTLETLELDFNLFFRRLSSVPLAEIATEDAAREKAGMFFYSEGVTGVNSEEQSRKRLGNWLCSWRDRIAEDWVDGGSGAQAGPSESRDAERREAMRMVNPNFVARGWVLDEVIRRVEKEGERDVLRRLIHMATHPFESSWHGQTFDGKVYEGDAEEERRWTENVPRTKRAMQCSCSS